MEPGFSMKAALAVKYYGKSREELTDYVGLARSRLIQCLFKNKAEQRTFAHKFYEVPVHLPATQNTLSDLIFKVFGRMVLSQLYGFFDKFLSGGHHQSGNDDFIESELLALHRGRIFIHNVRQTKMQKSLLEMKLFFIIFP
jgi:hypothetical protein